MYTYTNIQLWACTWIQAPLRESCPRFPSKHLCLCLGWIFTVFHVTAALVLAAHPSPSLTGPGSCTERLPWALGACTVTLVPLPALMGCAGLIQREICDGTHSGPGWTPLEPSLRLQQWLESRARTVQPEHRTPALSMGLMPCPAELQLFLNSEL